MMVHITRHAHIGSDRCTYHGRGETVLEAVKILPATFYDRRKPHEIAAAIEDRDLWHNSVAYTVEVMP